MGGRSGQGVVRNAAQQKTYKDTINNSEYKEVAGNRVVSEYLREEGLKSNMREQSSEQIEKSKEILQFEKTEKTLNRPDGSEVNAKTIGVYDKDGKFLSSTSFVNGQAQRDINDENIYKQTKKQLE